MVDAFFSAGASFSPRPRRPETHVDVEDDVSEEAASVRGRDGHLEHVGRQASKQFLPLRQARAPYARTLYEPDVATLGDIREAVSTLEDAGRIARRVLGSAHPSAAGIEGELEDARAALGARETQSSARP